jgi:hypothetical protein
VAAKKVFDRYTFSVEAEDTEVTRGHELLNRIAEANSQRTFLIEKFHFEDVLQALKGEARKSLGYG